MAQESKITTDHEVIREWAQERGGKPSLSGGTDDEEVILIDFSGENPRQISWDDFFSKFEDRKLVFLYQDETEEGEPSKFYKFLDRKEAEGIGERIQIEEGADKELEQEGWIIEDEESYK